MTICPTCYNKIPELALACPVCMRSKYLRSLELVEIQIIGQIIEGKLPVRLLKEGKRERFHLGYQDGFSKEAYCQVKLRSPRSSYCGFSERPTNLCPQCRSTFDIFLQRAGIATAK